jgi:hypothetical protein
MDNEGYGTLDDDDDDRFVWLCLSRISTLLARLLQSDCQNTLPKKKKKKKKKNQME